MEYMNNELVTEEVTENAEGTIAEETVEQVEKPAKSYSDDEVNQIVGRKLARQEKKLRREYEEKYGALEEVITAGTGITDVGEMTNTFRQHYENKGIQMPTKPSYTDKDVEVLASADAKEIIGYGFEEVVEETDRLAQKGVANMSPREKALFRQLAEYRQNAEKGQELAKIGVTEDIYNSDGFKTFSAQFKEGTPVTEIYKLYQKTQPRKEVQPMGSMKSVVSNDVKDFYTRDEALKFTKEDFDKNPALFKAVENSMLRW